MKEVLVLIRKNITKSFILLRVSNPQRKSSSQN